MIKFWIFVFLLLVVVPLGCGDVQARYNLETPCSEVDEDKMEILIDHKEIGHCTVRSKLSTLHIMSPQEIAGFEFDASWSIPQPIVEEIIPKQLQSQRIQADPFEDRQWGLDNSRSKDAWALSQGDGVKVWVIDTGYDLDHPDLPALADCANTNQPGQGCDDDNGHGTHVAGIIRMILDNGVGGVGAAPLVTVGACKALGANGEGQYSMVADCILEGIRREYDVINMSLGGPHGSNLVNAAVRYAYQQGVVLVAACGNEGMGPLGDACVEPAFRDEVISVGPIDENDRPQAWANRRPQIVAPGVAIFSSIPAGQYASWSGSSMATPFVSAAIALYLANNPDTSPDVMIQKLFGTTRQKTACPELHCGNGILDTYAALTDQPRPPTPTPTVTLSPYPPPEVTPTPTASRTFPIQPTATPTELSPTMTPTVDMCAGLQIKQLTLATANLADGMELDLDSGKWLANVDLSGDISSYWIRSTLLGGEGWSEVRVNSWEGAGVFDWLVVVGKLKYTWIVEVGAQGDNLPCDSRTIILNVGG